MTTLPDTTPAPSQIYATGTATILIVDDEPNNLKVLYELLARNNYDVRAARDGQTALEAIRAEVPDLILLDIKMPYIDGYEVCQILKSNAETRDIPIIFISALNQVEDIVRAFDAGGVDYITKPFRHAEVLARVRTHVTIVQQQQMLAFQREQIEAMRHRDRERFDNISRMREQFVSAAAHDLKNPLSLVTGYASMMRRYQEVRTSPELMECVENIEFSGKQMLELVTSMLDYIHMQSGVHLEVEKVDFGSFVFSHLESHMLTARQRQIRIKYSAPPSILDVQIDMRLMRRVIDNLLSNALKYSPDDTTITVAVREQGTFAVLAVTDQGRGIDAYEIPHLFDPFYRVKHPHQDIEGTGLGLSIVREILNHHLGRIEVASTPGEGSTFSVFLPLR